MVITLFCKGQESPPFVILLVAKVINIRIQGPVVRTGDIAIYWINPYPVDKLVSLTLIHWIVIFPVDIRPYLTFEQIGTSCLVLHRFL